MFKWCAYCQHWLGETEPFSDYVLTHGVCERCEPTAGLEEPSPRVLSAQALLAALAEAGQKGDLAGCGRFVGLALQAGLRPSEIMLGVLQPALYQLGKRWERGEVSVADEHRFTTFCARALEMLPLPRRPGAGAPLALLTMVEGNHHELGVRMLQRLAEERGWRCLAFTPGLPDAGILELALEHRPLLVGVSVSLEGAVPRALALARHLEEKLPAGTRVVVGGHAVRADPPVLEGVPILRSVDEFLKELTPLAASSALSEELGFPAPPLRRQEDGHADQARHQAAPQPGRAPA